MGIAMAPQVTVPDIKVRKRSKSSAPIVVLTAYDAPGARIADAGGVDIILVGDSAAMTVHGQSDTLNMTVEHMVVHVAAVSSVKPNALVVGDMPWLSYHLGDADTIRNAAAIIRAGAGAVKLEGGRIRRSAIEALVAAEIPVMGHIGLTPQSIHRLGGHRVQAKDPLAVEMLVQAWPKWDALPSCWRRCLGQLLPRSLRAFRCRPSGSERVPTVMARYWYFTICWV